MPSLAHKYAWDRWAWSCASRGAALHIYIACTALLPEMFNGAVQKCFCAKHFFFFFLFFRSVICWDWNSSSEMCRISWKFPRRKEENCTHPEGWDKHRSTSQRLRSAFRSGLESEHLPHPWNTPSHRRSQTSQWHIYWSPEGLKGVLG